MKAIIIVTYYQSLVLQLTLSQPQLSNLWNDFLLCGEMVVFSLCLTFAFPVKEFVGGIPDRRVLHNVKDVISVSDM